MTAQLPSKEQIELWLADAESVIESPMNGDEVAAARAIIAMGNSLLAAYEQEPVAYMIGGHYLIHADDPKVDNYTSAVPLYAHPAPSITATGYDNIKAIESAIAALKRTITEARRFRYCLGSLMNLDDEVAKLKATTALPALSIPAVPDECPKCDGAGMMDSGGLQPWGEPIYVICDCRYEMPTTAHSVPDEISTTDAMRIMNGRVITMSVHTAYKNGWNACRAAMLNGGKS